MCLEREGGREESLFFFFPVNSGSYPNAPGVMTKHQSATRMKRHCTLKIERCTRFVTVSMKASSPNL